MLTSLVVCLGKTNSACHRNLKGSLPHVERRWASVLALDRMGA